MNRFSFSKLLLVAVFSSAMPLFSQNETDALRFSTLEYGGTARSLGAGNSLGALGADYSTLSTNPAGLAAFRTNELVVTPSMLFSNNTSLLKGYSKNGEVAESKTSFHFDNVGLVFNNRPRDMKWRSANFAIGMNQLANYAQTTFYEGRSTGSLMDQFLAEGRSVGNDTAQLYPLGAGLAAQTNALYYQNSNELTTDFEAAPDALISRNQTIFERGKANELLFSYAGNYDDRFMLGATVGFPFFSFTQEKTYVEEDPDGEIDYFERLEFEEFLKTAGVGVNLKIGAIYKPIHAIRIGAAFHTPTLVGFTDNFNSNFSYEYSDANGSYSNYAEAFAEPFDYRLRTPWRAIGSLAVIISERGFLSGEVEYVDYASAKFNLTKSINSADNRDYERLVNQKISNSYGSALNIRLGGEAVLGRIRARAGYNLFGTPFAESGTKAFPTNAVSFGFGVRKNWFYFDLGYRFTQQTENFAPYSIGNKPGQTVETTAQKHDVLATFGFKF